MSDWWEDIVPIRAERVSALFQELGVARADAEEIAPWVLETTASCRLAFASAKADRETPMPSGISLGAILSQTQPRMSRGRPKTAQWGFWAAYLIREEVRLGGRPSNFYRSL